MAKPFTGISTVVLAIACFVAFNAKADAASGKCSNVSAQCAVEIGGRCDPATGHWEYGNRGNRGSGGTNRGGAFDQCVARKLKEKKK
jgi:hypothetical protein